MRFQVSKLGFLSNSRKPSGRGLITASFGSLGAAGASQVALLVSGVISARVLGPEDRGHVALLVLIASVIAIVIRLGTNSSIAYHVARQPGHSRFIFSETMKLIALQLISCVVIQGIVVWIVMGAAESYLRLAAVLSMTLGVSTIVSSYGLAALQGLRLFRWYNSLRILPVVSNALILLVFLPLGLSVSRVVAILALTSAASMIAIMFVAMRHLPEEADKEPPPTLSQIWKFGARGFFGSTSPLDTFRLDQMVVGFFLTPAALGLYVSALSFTNLPKFIANSLASVAMPNIAHSQDATQAKRILWIFVAVVTAMNIVLALIIGVMSETLVVFLFGDEFRSSAPIVRILLIAAVLVGSRRVLSEGLRALGMPGTGSIAEMWSWLVLVPLLFLLSPGWGLAGVGWAIVISALVSCWIVFHRARTHVPWRGSLTSLRSVEKNA